MPRAHHHADILYDCFERLVMLMRSMPSDSLRMAIDWIADEFAVNEKPHIEALAKAFIEAADEEM